jgi:hypothetical protein
MKQYTKNSNVKEHNYVLGDYVLVKQTKRNKWTTAYEPAFYRIIYRIEVSTISARRITDGRETRRDASHFKLTNSVVQNLEDENLDRPCASTEEEDWRTRKILRETK